MSSEPRERRDTRFVGIPVKGWIGLIITLGVMLIFLITLPAIRWFFLLSVPPGLLVGLVLYLLHRHRE